MVWEDQARLFELAFRMQYVATRDLVRNPLLDRAFAGLFSAGSAVFYRVICSWNFIGKSCAVQ